MIGCCFTFFTFFPLLRGKQPSVFCVFELLGEKKLRYLYYVSLSWYQKKPYCPICYLGCAIDSVSSTRSGPLIDLEAWVEVLILSLPIHRFKFNHLLSWTSVSSSLNWRLSFDSPWSYHKIKGDNESSLKVKVNSAHLCGLIPHHPPPPPPAASF